MAMDLTTGAMGQIVSVSERVSVDTDRGRLRI